MPSSSWLRRGLNPTAAGRPVRRDRPRTCLVRATLERLEDKIQPSGTIGTPLVLVTASGAEGFSLNQDVAAFSDTVPDPIGQYSAVVNWGDGTITSGSVSLHSDGLYYVFGSHGYTAPGTFPVKVTLYDGPVGGGSTSSATSTGGPITITPVNDPPIANGEDLGTIYEDSGPHTYSFGGLLANDLPGPQGESDEDGQTLTITTFANVTGGTAFIDSATNSIVFTPDADYSGPAGFDYTIRDNGLTNGVADFKSATAHASLTVAEVNDAPVANDEVLSAVAEDAAAFSIPFSTLLSNDSPGPANESGQALTITAVSNATGGAVAISGNNVVFTPSGDYNGPAKFTYTVRDNGTTNGVNDFKTATASAFFVITPVNDAPVPHNDILATAGEDAAAFTIPFSALLGNDSPGPANESGQTLTVTAVSGATGGTAVLQSGGILFTPAANFNGTASFTYTVQDNGDTNGAADPKTATAVASFTITEVNDPPTAAADSLAAVAEDHAAFSIPFSALLANDSPGPANESSQTLTITAVSNATGGTATISGTNVVFTPAADFNGTAGFTYTARDNGTTNGANDFKTATAAASFTVTAVNDPPVAQGDTLSVPQNTLAFTIPFSALLANDSPGPADESSQTLTVTGVASAVGGTAVLQSGGVLFTRAANFSGPAGFTYTVQDNGTTGGAADPKTATAAASFNLADAPINLSPATLPHATVGAAYSQTLSASGGVGGPFTFAVTGGALPAGITLSPGGALSGMNTTAATVSFTVTATGAGGFTGSQSYNFTTDPKVVTPVIAIADKVYDGTTAATITSVALSGVLPGDVGGVSLTAGTANFADKNAGSGKAVTVTGLSLTGPAAGNYTLAGTTATATASIGKATLLVTADSYSRQYSDPNPSFAASITGFVGGETLATSGVTGAAGAGTAATPASPPGQYAVAAGPGSLASGNYAFRFASGVLYVLPEDAKASYTGATYVATNSASDGAAAVTLSATVRDASLFDAGDTTPGDVRTALVAFVNRATGQVLADNVPVALVNSADARLGTASATVSLPVNTPASPGYFIDVRVKGSYASSPVANDGAALVEVASQAAGTASGGGTLANLRSTGQVAGDSGLATNFAFSARTGAAPSGGVSVLVRKGGGAGTNLYLITGTALQALSATANSLVLRVSGSITDVSDPAHPLLLDGNVTIRLSAQDGGAGGAADAAGVTVFKANGDTWLNSSFLTLSSTAINQALASGNVAVVTPQRLAGPPAAGGAAPTLTEAQLAPVVAAAAARWYEAGVPAAALRAALGRFTVRIDDLPGSDLGSAGDGQIRIDRDAAGHGWFVDPTPFEDSEFAPGAVDGPAAGRVDLLTVVAHELGHALGLDSNASDRLMGEFLPVGVRRLPTALEAGIATPQVRATTTLSSSAPARENQPAPPPAAWVAGAVPARRPRLYVALLADAAAEEQALLG